MGLIILMDINTFACSDELMIINMNIYNRIIHKLYEGVHFDIKLYIDVDSVDLQIGVYL